MLSAAERHVLTPWFRTLQRLYGRLLVGFALALVASLSAVGLLALSGWFITASALTGMALAAGVAATLDIYTPGAGIRSFAIIRTVARYAERVMHHDAVLRLQGQWRLQLFRWLLGTRLEQQQQLRMGHVVQRLTQDLSTLDALYLRVMVPPLLAAGSGTLLVVLVAIQYWPGAIVLAVSLLGLWWLNTGLAVRLTKTAGEQEVQYQEHLRTAAMDFTEALPELSAWQTAARHEQNLITRSEQLLACEREQQAHLHWLETLTQFALHMLVVVMAGLAVVLWLEQVISGPVAVMLALATLALGETWQPLASQAAHLGRVLGAARRLQQWQGGTSGQVVGGSSAAAARGQRISQPPGRSDTAVPATGQQVTFGWHDLVLARPARALQLTDQVLTPGSQLSICGPSGVGKSTLGVTLAGLLAPAQGEVRLAHQALDSWPAGSLRRLVDYLPQHNQVLQGTVAMNLRLARPGAPDTALWEVLEWVGLADRIAHAPEQLQLYLGASPAAAEPIAAQALSGGEARRLCLARLLLRDPQVVILDEPFTGVDKATRQQLLNNIEPWLLERTVIWLGHDADQFPTTQQYWLSS